MTKSVRNAGRGPDSATEPADAARAAVRTAAAAFDDALFAALRDMAARSPRFQADVQAAMRARQLSAPPTRVAASLQRLEHAGRVSNQIELADGGVLVTVSV